MTHIACSPPRPVGVLRAWQYERRPDGLAPADEQARRRLDAVRTRVRRSTRLSVALAGGALVASSYVFAGWVGTTSTPRSAESRTTAVVFIGVVTSALITAALPPLARSRRLGWPQAVLSALLVPPAVNTTVAGYLFEDGASWPVMVLALAGFLASVVAIVRLWRVRRELRNHPMADVDTAPGIER